MQHPKLRDQKRLLVREPYPLNEIPDEIIYSIGGFRTADYTWEANKNGNLIGIEKYTGITRFTWQPHGSQFTIHTTVPDNARKFTLRHPDPLKKDDILEKIGFDSSWLTFTNN